MKILEILGYIAGISFMLFMFYCLMRNFANNTFQKHMRTGQKCFFYNGENREICYIVFVYSDGTVTVRDLYGNFYQRYHDELYV